jgi:hypothetical protein
MERRPGRLSGGEASQVRLRPLRTQLPDMKPGADSAHRRNATGRKIIGEQLRGLHLPRIGVSGQPDSPLRPPHPQVPERRG